MLTLVLIWLGIAIGILVSIILIIKISKTPFHESISLNSNCKKCGYKTNGLKCPRCDNNSFFNKFK